MSEALGGMLPLMPSDRMILQATLRFAVPDWVNGRWAIHTSAANQADYSLRLSVSTSRSHLEASCVLYPYALIRLGMQPACNTDPHICCGGVIAVRRQQQLIVRARIHSSGDIGQRHRSYSCCTLMPEELNRLHWTIPHL